MFVRFFKIFEKIIIKLIELLIILRIKSLHFKFRIYLAIIILANEK